MCKAVQWYNGEGLYGLAGRRWGLSHILKYKEKREKNNNEMKCQSAMTMLIVTVMLRSSVNTAAGQPQGD